VSKPFGTVEFMARPRGVLRAPAFAEEVPIVETPDFSIELADKRARRADGADLRLTATE